MKSYSETQQAIYFDAARKLFRLAATVLNDCIEPAEFRGSTAQWAKQRARSIATEAYRLENLGHELTVATARQDTENFKAKTVFGDAVTRHERLVTEYGK